MPIDVIVPRLGWSMEEGAFVAWLKKDGELVRAGEPLFSIEGDKAVQEIESIDSGILRIAANGPKPGDAIRVGDLLGHLLSADESTPAAPPAPMAAGANAESRSSPDEARSPAQTSAAPLSASPATAGGRGGAPAISPRALRVAAELGVDWTPVAGTGRTGRIRECDVRAAAGGGRAIMRAAGRAVGGSGTPGGGRPAAVFFGELLMRLETRQHERFVQAREFEVRYTGAEANAAVSIANFGLDAVVVSVVPEHELGQACINYLRQHGVSADHVLRGGTRLGLFFLEAGAPPRASKVIYDRAGSGFAELRPGQIDWDTILAGRQWFHWSGTAPALGPGLSAVVAEACAAAKRHGLRVSCDLNYRTKLWSADTARQTMTPLMRQVDVLIANEEQIGLVLGVGAQQTSGGKAGVGSAAFMPHQAATAEGRPSTSSTPTPSDAAAASRPRSGIESCTRMAGALRTRFGFRDVALTRRDNSDGDGNTWQCLLVNEAGAFVSRTYPVAAVDRIGAGDAFSGALIYGMLAGLDNQDAIEFAAAAGCLKHSIPGDFNLASRDEVLALVRGDAGHRVQR